MRGSGSAAKGRLARRSRALPNGLQLPPRSRVPCPALPTAVNWALGSTAQRRLQVGALPAASERAPRSALYNPRPGRAGGGIGPPSARPSPPPGAPRPRPSPPPARRPPSAEPRRGSPSHMAVAAASSPRRASLRDSRPLPWGVPASACQAWQSAVSGPSSFCRPVRASPYLDTFVKRGTLDGPSCDQALRKTALQAGGAERRTSAARH